MNLNKNQSIRWSITASQLQTLAQRFGISSKSLYDWIKNFSKTPKLCLKYDDLQEEVARLKNELKRAEQERVIQI